MADEVYDSIFKIVLVGDSGVGKSNILLRYVKNEFNHETKATVGVEFGSKNFVIDNTKIRVQIWDTAGQERFRSLTSAYYKGSKGAIVTYDITNQSTFSNVDKWITELRKNADDKIRILLVGNKKDLENERVISFEEGQKKANIYNIIFIETSALNGENIENAFLIMVKDINENLSKIVESIEEDYIADGVKLQTEKKTDNKKKCC